MTASRRLFVAGAVLIALGTFRPHAQEQSVPADLKLLLAAPQTEMRMVVQRYTATTPTGRVAAADVAARRSPVRPRPVRCPFRPRASRG